MSRHRALLLGATGLIGQHLLQRLLTDPHWSEVQVITRRPIATEHEKLHKIVLPLTQMASRPELFAVDAVFCCLGTTLRAAGSRAAFRQVDFDFCVQAAELARAQGVNHFLLVSAVNARATSPVFYSRVKGEAEAAIVSLDFPSLSIVQPSLLLGQRDTRRPGEQVAGLLFQAVRPLAGWSNASWLPVEAAQVADAMAVAGRAPQPGTRRLRYRDLKTLAARIDEQPPRPV